MGYNTSMLILNDALSDIEKDNNFGKSVSDAVRKVSCYQKPVDVRANNYINAATVIETHHADHLSAVLFGENYGQVLKHIYIPINRDNQELELLKALSEKLGYKLIKKKNV
jgi:hypothetical protein